MGEVLESWVEVRILSKKISHLKPRSQKAQNVFREPSQASDTHIES